MSLTKVTYSMINGSPTNVLDHGADPTGTLNSYSAIQECLNLGGKIYIPKGTYKIETSLTVGSNTEIYGDGASTIIQIAADNVWCFTTGYGISAKENIYIHDLLLDGGGQTTNINTGYKAGRGIYGSRVNNFYLDNLIIRKMGIVQAANPIDDNGWGGFGMLIEARYGAISNIKVTNCTITNIAGQGSVAGDGIEISGFAPGVGFSKVTAVIENCWISTCGRDCISLTGGGTETIATSIQVTNCYLEKAFSSGIDLEESCDVTITDCEFYLCGNDQTYGNPVALYGATYRLLAGLATGGSSDRIIVSDCRFIGCYYGMTEGFGDGLLVSNCIFGTSTVSDYAQGLASSARNVKLLNCQFNTALTTLSRYNTLADYFSCIGCTFAGTVFIQAMKNGTFDACIFNKGFLVSSGSSGFSNNQILNSYFKNWAGAGIQFSASDDSTDCAIRGCYFLGTGNMTYGIQFAFHSALRCIIDNNTFKGCATAGIYQPNSDGRANFSACNNTFISCAKGISIVQSLNYSAINNNKFYGTTTTCIEMTGIDSGTPLSTTSVSYNISDNTSLNGVVITVSSGTIDWCIFTGNNMHGPTGTKWSISAGNANGISTGNLTT